MARYTEHHKQATRQRIVDSAARRLKADGVTGSGVSTLMADAGLTNGAFYVHFDSKADLVATVVGEELAAQRSAATGLPGGAAGLAALVSGYLSAEHRDHPAGGCPSAAMIEEIGRCDGHVRETYTRGIVEFADVIASYLDVDEPDKRRVRVLAAFAGMVGTLQMARTVNDPALSDALLAHGIDNALLVLGIDVPAASSPAGSPSRPRPPSTR
jgi:AcrR family transcriptional regulator